MAASVLFACGLNEQKLPSFVHISEESNVDGSFLISSILGQRLRISNAGTVLVCLQHNYQHYFHAGMRLGYNTNIFNGKTLHVVDPLTEMARNGITCKWLRDERRLTLALLEAIRDHINTSVAQRNSTTVLIDNLAILLNLGATKEEIILMCHDLADLPKQYENLTVITKMSNCDLYEPLDNNVAKLGTLRIRASQLKSGVSRDVDGKLLIEREVIANNDGDVQQKFKHTYALLPETKKEIEQQKEPEQAKKENGNIVTEKMSIPPAEETKSCKSETKTEQPEESEQKSEELLKANQVEHVEEPAPVQEKQATEQKEIEVEENKLTPPKEEMPEEKQEQKEEEKNEIIEPEKVEVEEKRTKQLQEQEQMDTHETDGYVLELVRKEVLYKVNDRGIKIMSPGQIGVRV